MSLPQNTIIIYLVTLFLVLYSLYPKNIVKILLLVSFLSLFIIQISTTRIATIFEYSGLEKTIISQRPYNFIDPPQFYRFREYFFSLFKSVSPIFLLGVYSYILRPKKLITILLIITLLTFSFISPNGKFGPILLTPFIYFLTLYAFRLVKK